MSEIVIRKTGQTFCLWVAKVRELPVSHFLKKVFVMEFFRGFLSVLFLSAVFFGIVYYSKQFGIKQGKEIATKELNVKLQRCQRILTSGK